MTFGLSSFNIRVNWTSLYFYTQTKGDAHMMDDYHLSRTESEIKDVQTFGSYAALSPTALFILGVNMYLG